MTCQAPGRPAVVAEAATPAPVRVLIASPDANLRMQLRRLLAAAPTCEVVATTRFGEKLREAVGQAMPDFVVVDARADEAGAALAVAVALQHKLRPLVLHGPVRGSFRGVPATALLACPDNLPTETAAGAFAEQLKAMLRMPAAAQAKRPTCLSRPSLRPEVIAFGSSTGGPPALVSVFKALGRQLCQPMVLTQHMPPRFTTMLAQQINRDGPPTLEAADGMVLQPGHLYVAPGGRHLLLERQAERLVCVLGDGPPENFCKPAVDVMLRSVVRVCGGRALAVILTGMGSDGLLGCRQLVAAGGTVLAQDEATSVVWGMPGAVAQAGLCKAVLPLDAMADAINLLAAKATP